VPKLRKALSQNRQGEVDNDEEIDKYPHLILCIVVSSALMIFALAVIS
jgi:hypothetical protein